MKSFGVHNLKHVWAVILSTGLFVTCLLPGGVMPTWPVQAAAADHVVISEIYGGGGNSGSIWKNDFIEIYNPTDTTVSLAGWTVQYASASGTFSLKTNLSGSIGPHKYYLIQEAAGTGGTQSLPTPDATGTISMSATSAKVALANSTATVTGPTGANVVDFVGYGSSANQYQGSGRAPAPSNTASIERKANDGTDPTTIGEGKGNGWDDNNNATDLVVRSSPAPQNASAAAETASTGTVQVTGVTLNKSTTTIGVGQTDSFVGTVQPSNATNKNVTWSTSNSAVATISSTGVVTGVATGLATITVTTQDGGFTANCTVTVTAAPVYNTYYGQLHSHTSYSDGQGTPSQAYAYARDTGHADFFAITDHSNSFDSPTDWTKSTEWADTKQQSDNYNADGKFVALAGFEMTWSGGIGHMNTFNTDWFESRLNTSMNLQNYYNKLVSDPNSVSQWNHPGTTFGTFQNFAYFSAANDTAIDLM